MSATNPHSPIADPLEKQIDVIFGGPASGGDSSSARKAYARSEIGKRPAHDEDLDIIFKLGGKETEVKDSYGVVHGGKAPISVQRYHRAPDPQPAQGGRLDLSSAPKVPDSSRGWRGQE
ncbi:hypothetical protein B296_00041832 [Ensete ventricosum]|uniref:Uncharacterized protein n=1 Tax=Ensete ventricosum TaxID=4639 RepID=A0A426XYI7_ENSVE|nr:hypothetical protein B296_00041832 [Ensete ventricosum]